MDKFYITKLSFIGTRLVARQQKKRKGPRINSSGNGQKADRPGFFPSWPLGLQQFSYTCTCANKERDTSSKQMVEEEEGGQNRRKQISLSIGFLPSFLAD